MSRAHQPCAMQWDTRGSGASGGWWPLLAAQGRGSTQLVAGAPGTGWAFQYGPGLAGGSKGLHGHSPAPMAAPLGGALDVDLIRQWTIPVAPTSHKKLPCDLSLTHLCAHEKRNV